MTLRRAMFLVLSGLAACKSADNGSSLSLQQEAAISDSLRHMIVAAYDMRDTSGFATRLMSLYADSGRIVSATAGRASASRDTLEQGIRWFWENVGRNMRKPTWTWGPMFVDVLSPDAAVVTATYRVPHTTPNGQPHVIGGAWTAVFERRGGRWGIIQEHLSDLPAGP